MSSEKSDLSLEYRIYRILLIMGISLNIYAMIINSIVGFSVIIILISFITGLFLFLTHKFLKKRKNYIVATNIILTVITFVMYPTLWILQGGSLGAGSYFLILHSIMIVILLNKSGIKFHLTAHITIVSLMLFLEYKFPNLITGHIPEVPRILSVGVSLVIICICSSFMVSIVMYQYNKNIKELLSIKNNLEEVNNQLELVSITDELSGIYNRRFIMNKLEDEIKRGLISVIMFDIDHFKKINDNFGHQTGDKVIKIFSRLLEENVRKSDYIGRIGGEEFLILLPGASLEEAYKRAERIRNLVSSLDWGDLRLKVTVSGGVYSTPTYQSVNEVLVGVDERLYKAKKSGRNLVIQ